ncbi:hypothetical protein, partial [Marinomonas transparens]
YDADIGRFISPDPVVQYHSPYLYGMDDPLTMVDPDGEWSLKTFAIGAHIAGNGVEGSSASSITVSSRHLRRPSRSVSILQQDQGPNIDSVVDSFRTESILTPEQINLLWYDSKSKADDYMVGLSKTLSTMSILRSVGSDVESSIYDEYFGHYLSGSTIYRHIEPNVRKGYGKLSDIGFQIMPLPGGRLYESSFEDDGNKGIITFSPEYFKYLNFKDKNMELTSLIIGLAMDMALSSVVSEEGKAYKDTKPYVCSALHATKQRYVCNDFDAHQGNDNN